MDMKKQAEQYLERQILSASPAEQIVMLYDGAIKFLTKAAHAIEINDVQERYNNNKRASDIIAYLMDILDVEKGGDVGQRLMLIYNHCLRRLLDVDMHNDKQAAEEVISHLRALRQSWVEIGQSERGKSARPKGGNEPKKSSADSESKDEDVPVKRSAIA